MTPLSSAKDHWSAAEAGERIGRCGRPQCHAGTGGCRDATFLGVVWFSCRCWPFPAVSGRLYKPIAITNWRHDSLLHLNALTCTPVAASWLLGHGWKEPIGLSRLLQPPPTLAGPAGATVLQGLGTQLSRRRWVLASDYSAGLLAGWGLGQLANRASSPEDDSQVRGGRGAPRWCLTAPHRAGALEKGSGRLVAKKSWCGSATSTPGPAPSATAPQKRHLLPAPTTAGSSGWEGNAKGKQQPNHRQRGAAMGEQIPMATVLRVSLPPCGDSAAEGGWKLELLRHQRRPAQSQRLRGRGAELHRTATPRAFERVQHTLQCRTALVRLEPDRLRMAFPRPSISTPFVDTLGPAFGRFAM